VKTYFQKIPPAPKTFGGKTSNFRQIIEDRRQSEARNFETAQRSHKQRTCISSAVNALQNGSKAGAITTPVFDATWEEYWQSINDAHVRPCRTLPTSRSVSAARTLASSARRMWSSTLRTAVSVEWWARYARCRIDQEAASPRWDAGEAGEQLIDRAPSKEPKDWKSAGGTLASAESVHVSFYQQWRNV